MRHKVEYAIVRVPAWVQDRVKDPACSAIKDKHRILIREWMVKFGFKPTKTYVWAVRDRKNHARGACCYWWRGHKVGIEFTHRTLRSMGFFKKALIHELLHASINRASDEKSIRKLGNINLIRPPKHEELVELLTDIILKEHE